MDEEDAEAGTPFGAGTLWPGGGGRSPGPLQLVFGGALRSRPRGFPLPTTPEFDEAGRWSEQRPSLLLQMLDHGKVWHDDGREVATELIYLGDIDLPTGRLGAWDPLLGGNDILVPEWTHTGTFPVLAAHVLAESQVVAAIVMRTNRPVVRWHLSDRTQVIGAEEDLQGRSQLRTPSHLACLGDPDAFLSVDGLYEGMDDEEIAALGSLPDPPGALGAHIMWDGFSLRPGILTEPDPVRPRWLAVDIPVTEDGLPLWIGIEASGNVSVVVLDCLYFLSPWELDMDE